MRWYGEGPFHRELKNAIRITKKSHFIIREGDAIYNKLFAWKGSFGIVPRELDGMFVSDKFPTYELNRDKIDENYLRWYFRYPPLWAEAQARSTGSAAISKLTLNPPQFLHLTIPLPPLKEQRRIVARLDELASKIKEARSLRKQAAVDTEALISRTTTTLLDGVGWERQRLAEILSQPPRNGLSPKPQVDNGGTPMLRINAVSSSANRFVDLSTIKSVAVSESEAAPFRLQHEDVFIVRYNGDINRVAKPAIYKTNGQRAPIFPDKLMRLRTDPQKMLPDFLVFALSTQSVRGQIEELGKTTAGNIGISGANAKSFVVPVPPLVQQSRIVAELDALQARVDALRRVQEETAVELDALLPSILDRAFKGEL